MTLEKLTKHVHLDTAEEFVDAISPRGPYLKPAQPPSVWVFRGHGRSTYQLIPSALRPIPHVCFSRFEPVINADSSIRELPRIPWEFDALANFFREADAVGLPLPEDTQLLRKDLGDSGDSLLQRVHHGEIQWQGKRRLKCWYAKYLREVVEIPSGDSASHGDAVLVVLLFEQA